MKVLFDVDDDNEATGVIHWYCCEACRPLPGEWQEAGESGDCPDGAICEGCLKPLEGE